MWYRSTKKDRRVGFEVIPDSGKIVHFKKVSDWMHVTTCVNDKVIAKETYPYINIFGADPDISRLIAAHREGYGEFEWACDRLVRNSLAAYRKENRHGWKVAMAYLRALRKWLGKRISG